MAAARCELLAARYPQYRASPPAGPVIRIQVDALDRLGRAAGLNPQGMP